MAMFVLQCLSTLCAFIFQRFGQKRSRIKVCLRDNARMDTKWLEDFVSLAETRSFSRSAQLRHVTQSAFSRRIQSLEAWAGADLVDRSSYPTTLTPAGEVLHAKALDLLQSLQSAKTEMKEDHDKQSDNHKA
jgi:DNA-binding transcriptional LysR family regulator